MACLHANSFKLGVHRLDIREIRDLRAVLLSRKLSSALADRRKAAAQSVDLAAKLAVVQKQLQDATDEKDEMAIIVEEAWKMATEQRELRELASASAGTCKLILDDARSTSSRELSRSN